MLSVLELTQPTESKLDALKCCQFSESIWFWLLEEVLYLNAVSSSQWMMQRGKRKCSVRTKSWSSTQPSSFSIAKICASYGSALMRLDPRAPKRLVTLPWFYVRISTSNFRSFSGHMKQNVWSDWIQRMVPLLLSYVIPLRYCWAFHFSGFPLPFAVDDYTFPFLTAWVCNIQTVCFSAVTPSSATGYLYHTNFDVLLSGLVSESRSLTFQKVFSVWPLAKQWRGDIENNAHWRQRKLRMVLIVGTTGSVTLTHLLHRLDR